MSNKSKEVTSKPETTSSWFPASTVTSWSTPTVDRVWYRRKIAWGVIIVFTVLMVICTGNAVKHLVKNN